MDDIDPPGIFLRQSVGDITGAVGGVIVHDDDKYARRQGQQLGHQRFDVLPFVVRGYDDVYLQNHLQYSSAPGKSALS